uniref:C1q domain-containing protein n=1 Tax=Esox lucius TaxID=8010 RepID=A0AAY5KDZ6_ESOLU
MQIAAICVPQQMLRKMRFSVAGLVFLCSSQIGALVVFPDSSEVKHGMVTTEHPGEAEGSRQPNMSDLLLKLVEMENRLTAAENQAKDVQKENEGTKVAFSVGLGGTGYYGPFNTDVTLVYPIVLTNFGNAYNPATGIFTAPVGGVYHFTVYHHSGPNRRSDSMLYKNHDQIAFISALNKDGSYNGSNGVILQLEKGDVVYVRLMADSWLWDHVNNVPHHGSKGWCHFNGILLFPE